MKKPLLLLLFVTLTWATLPAATYYISTTGNDANPGTVSQPWRTIQKGASTAVAGDIVYIKAGNYGAENVVIQNSGTSSNPIVFEGYKNNPGDILTPAWLDLHKSGGHAPPTIDPNEMPLIASGDLKGYGISIASKKYVEIRNIQITGFLNGVYLYSADNIILNNLIAKSSGQYGIGLYAASDCKVLNCKATDNESTNIYLGGAINCLVENCMSTDGVGGIVTDYHIVITSSPREAYGNTIRHCFAQNNHKGTDGHGGHGIGLKDAYGRPIRNNIIEDCVSMTMSNCFYVRHANVYDNKFANCTAYGEHNAISSVSGIVVRDGAHDNEFISCRIIGLSGATWGLRCFDSSEDKTESPNGKNTYSGYNNSFVNCIFKNCNIGINFNLWSSGFDSPAVNNKFINCVFANGGTLIYHTTNNNNGNIMKNCIVTDFSTLSGGTGSSNVAITYSDFYQNSFSMPSGTGNISQDPLFADAANSDFHLKSEYGRWDGSTWVHDAVTSPCIDAGDPAGSYTLEPAPNGSRINIGAYGNTAEASKSGDVSSTFQAYDSSGDISLSIYPNPAYGRAQIEFDLTKNTKVWITLCNVLGNEFSTVVNTEMSAGTHRLDISDYLRSAGVYIVRIKAGNAVISRKLINIK